MPHVAAWFAPALAAIFFTSVFQGAVGFGMALLCIPIFSTFADPKLAVECITVASLGGSVGIALAYRSHWDLRRAAWLGIPLLLGTPIGVLLLKILSNHQIRVGVGGMLVLTSGAYVLSLLLGKRAKPVDIAAADEEASGPGFSEPVCVAVGALSGVIGGATGMTGPLMANYLIRTGIKREAFKVTLNLIFTASASWRAGLYVATGMLSRDVLALALIFIPVAYIGTGVGLKLSNRIPAEHFMSFIHFILLGMGAWFVCT